MCNAYLLERFHDYGRNETALSTYLVFMSGINEGHFPSQIKFIVQTSFSQMGTFTCSVTSISTQNIRS